MITYTLTKTSAMSAGNALYANPCTTSYYGNSPCNGDSPSDPSKSFLQRMISNVQCRATSVDCYLRSERDPLTKSALRFNGFWNDGGEALKSFLPKSVYYGTYVATGVYALGAVYYTKKRLTDQLNEKCPPTDPEHASGMNDINIKTTDNALWHLFATISLTPLAIAGIKQQTTKALANQLKISPLMRGKIIPGGVGLLMIPVIVPPIDNLVTCIFNLFRTDKQEYHWSGLYAGLSKKH